MLCWQLTLPQQWLISFYLLESQQTTNHDIPPRLLKIVSLKLFAIHITKNLITIQSILMKLFPISRFGIFRAKICLNDTIRQ